MKYCTTVIAVRDMEKSLQFYKDLFQQDVLVDLGKNKTLTCGLALQQGLEHIAGFDTRDPKFSDEEFNENIAIRVQALKKE